MNTTKLQTLLFQEIRNKIPSHLSLAESTAELLNISADSAYRRIRGEKMVSLEELQTLVGHYGISMDKILNSGKKSFIFEGELMEEEMYDLKRWLTNLNKTANYVGLQENAHIYYLAKDVPFLYPLQFPVLAGFKDFFRKKTLMALRQTKTEKFSIHRVDHTLNDIALEIVRNYNAIPSTEIWSSESFNSIFKQIQFYHFTGQFESRADALHVLDNIEMLINHLEHQAEIGVKYTHGEKPEKTALRYNLYNNELFIGEDTILVDMGTSKLTFLNHSFINYMTTVDEKFCDYTFKTIRNIMSRSTPVSWVGEKERKIFFNSLKKRLNEVRLLK